MVEPEVSLSNKKGTPARKLGDIIYSIRVTASQSLKGAQNIQSPFWCSLETWKVNQYGAVLGSFSSISSVNNFFKNQKRDCLQGLRCGWFFQLGDYFRGRLGI